VAYHHKRAPLTKAHKQLLFLQVELVRELTQGKGAIRPIWETLDPPKPPSWRKKLWRLVVGKKSKSKATTAAMEEAEEEVVEYSVPPPSWFTTRYMEEEVCLPQATS
jgi:hypothetical protein